jgi:hypothetical protein
VVGTAAVAVMPGVTVHSDSMALSLPQPRSFRLPEVGVSLASVAELDRLVQAMTPSSVRVAGWDELCTSKSTAQAGRAVLDRVDDHYAPRLVLFYERHDQSVGALLSDVNVAEWLGEIEAVLRATQGGASLTHPRPISDRPAPVELARTPIPACAPCTAYCSSHEASGTARRCTASSARHWSAGQDRQYRSDVTHPRAVGHRQRTPGRSDPRCVKPCLLARSSSSTARRYQRH